MANAMPIVATRVGGIPETLADGLGRDAWYQPAIRSALADALQFAIEHPAEAVKWGERARDRIRRDFSIETIARRHLELYQSALEAVRA